MKKILSLILISMLALTLAGCDLDEYLSKLRPDAYAPAVTEDEAEFIAMVQELETAVVAIENTYKQDNNQSRRGSGVVVKVEAGLLTNIYTVLTSQWVVEDALSLNVYVTSLQSYPGVVLNYQASYDANSDIAVVTFETNRELSVVELNEFDDSIELLKTREIFSIGTPITLGYFNYVTNKALIMGNQGNILIHGTNLNYGQIGSPLFLKSTGQLIGINTKYSTTAGSQQRPEVLINHALFVNRVIELVEGYL